MLKRGGPVYPWPSDRSPSDNWKRAALRKLKMYEWVDPNGNKWNHVPQTTVNVFDRVLNSLPLAVVVKRAPLELGENFNF